MSSCFADILLKTDILSQVTRKYCIKIIFAKKIAKDSTHSAECYVMCLDNYFKSLWDFCTDLGFTTLVIPLCTTC